MKTDNANINLEFRKEVEKISGQKLADCYQCGKCSAGCPVGYAMISLPDKIMRFAQLGMIDQALESDTPWLCASCETCASRCPQEVEIPRVMEAIRVIALRKNSKAGKKVGLFYSIFNNNIKMFSRIYEPMMMGLYNLFSGNFFKDIMPNGMTLIGKGKLGFIPHLPGKLDNMKKIFERAEKEKS